MFENSQIKTSITISMLHRVTQQQGPLFAQCNQLLRHTSLLTLLGQRAALFLLTFPEVENSRSQGTVVAGDAKYL